MHSPILLSTPRRSGDLRLLAHYHLTDKGIVYGVHFHGGPRTKLTVANQKRLGKLFAGPRTRKFAIIVDDLGRVGPSGRVDRPGWSDDFTAFVANWTINRGGDGAIGAAWTRYGPERHARAPRREPLALRRHVRLALPRAHLRAWITPSARRAGCAACSRAATAATTCACCSRISSSAATWPRPT